MKLTKLNLEIIGQSSFIHYPISLKKLAQLTWGHSLVSQFLMGEDGWTSHIVQLPLNAFIFY
jgi:hypothetical protein